MGSFQQVVMGGICLVAVFWFGAYINEQPAALQKPLERFSDATAGTETNRSQVPSHVAAKPQGGLLSSFFEAPAKPRSITLSDLKSRSPSGTTDVSSQNLGTPFVAVNDSATEIVSDFVEPPLPNLDVDPSFVVNNQSDGQRLEIVPDFSTLAQDFRREQAAQQPADQLSKRQTASSQQGFMLPVPKLDDFSRASFGESLDQPNRDWNAVKQSVLSVEEKLRQFHKAHPVAEKFEPLRPVESRLPVAAETTSGRFIPQASSERQRQDIQRQEIDRQQIERLQASLQEYERQELERQEIQRQELRKRRPQAFSPNESWNNSDLSAASRVPLNELRSENQFSRRGQHRQQRFEPSHQPAPPESLAQRQERWKVFGDRTRASEKEMDVQQDESKSSAPSRTAAEVRYSKVRSSEGSIPEASRVRSLYEMPMDDVARGQRDTAASRQDTFPNQNTLESPTQRQRIATASAGNDVGPEFIRYGDFETYVTEGGDTLQTISESFFGTPEYYFDLYLANRNVLVNPATVPAGVELRIPRMGQ